MSKTHLKAKQEWDKIPGEFQLKILNNIFCNNCGNTTIVDYEMSLLKYGLTLKGKCIKCNNDVARVIENN